VIAGPTAREREDKEDWSVEGDARELILPRAAAMYPALEQARPLGAYAGLRTAGHGGANYVIERSRATPGVIHVAAIRSTGLSASLAIGELVAGMLAEDGRVELGPPRALECDGCATPRYEPAPAAGEGSTAVPWWEWGSRHRGARR
jgi:glycerol-3-phosphate dehydrogenase